MSGFYRYYDSPDGKDFFKKEYYLFRRAFPFCYYLSWFDVVAHTRPTGLVPVAARLVQSFSRPLICVSLWNVTTYFSTRLRNKDDPINHAIGVIPVAMYLKNFIPSPAVYIMAIPLMVCLAGAKQYKLWYPHMVLTQEMGNFRDDADNTLYADYFSFIRLGIKEKNWLTIEDAIKKGVVASKEEAKEKKLSNYKDGQVRGLIKVGDGSENHPLNL